MDLGKEKKMRIEKNRKGKEDMREEWRKTEAENGVKEEVKKGYKRRGGGWREKAKRSSAGEEKKKG